MFSIDDESSWAGIKGNGEVDYSACFNAHCACNTAFSGLGSQSLLKYLKGDKSAAPIMLFTGAIYLALPRSLAHMCFTTFHFN